MKRRTFFSLTAGTTVASLASRCVGAQPPISKATPPASPTHISQDGLLKLALTAEPWTVPIGDRQVNCLTYNRQTPGPRLEAKAGDMVNIRFTNHLPHATNLHYHGLHVPPSGVADNVFLSVPPGESLDYQFQIPANHPAGLFWYHPHHHGHVTEQILGGLMGLFVVRGALDEIPEVKAAQEEFLIIKDYNWTRSEGLSRGNPMAAMTGQVGDVLTLNGKINPTLTLTTGGLLRLRFLNATASRFLDLSLENHPFYLIATDGGAIANPIELSQLVLAPGERADVLIKGDRAAGSYRLQYQSLNVLQGMGMMSGGMMGGMHHSVRPTGTNQSTTLATVTYRGTTTPAIPLPDRLLPVIPLSNPVAERQFTLNHTMGMARANMAFFINDQTFDPNRIDTLVKLNTVEDWEIRNEGMMAHPFHLHINPCQILSRNGRRSPYAAWKDVVSIAPGEVVRIRIAFRDYPGKTVYHCHILDHEDLGMMGTLLIQ